MSKQLKWWIIFRLVHYDRTYAGGKVVRSKDQSVAEILSLYQPCFTFFFFFEFGTNGHGKQECRLKYIF